MLVELQPLLASGALLVERHEGWLTTHTDFEQGAGKSAPWRMDAFYRHVRQRTGLLMEGARPVGGKYSFDTEIADLMTTKPYISGAAYINRMSDFCRECAFDPAKNCPITRLYWAFLARHEQRLLHNPRFFGPMAALRKRVSNERVEDARIFASVREQLASRALLSPASLVRRSV